MRLGAVAQGHLRLQGAAQALEFQMRAQAGEHFLRLEGFGDVVHRPGGKARQTRRRVGQRGHEEHGHVRHAGGALEAAAGLETVQTAGHHHVEQYEIGSAVGDLQERALAAVGDQRLEARAGEQVEQDGKVGGRVVDQEDGGAQRGRGGVGARGGGSGEEGVHRGRV